MFTTLMKFFAMAAVVGAALIVITPAAGAKDIPRGYAAWIWGPETCVHVRSYRSRQTRYGGAPRCRRFPV